MSFLPLYQIFGITLSSHVIHYEDVHDKEKTSHNIEGLLYISTHFYSLLLIDYKHTLSKK